MRRFLATDVAGLALAELAAQQHGVVSAAQLAGLGLDAAAVRRRVTHGRLHRLHRGVYAVGHRVVGADGRRRAATLALGPAAALGVRSGTDLWQLRGYSGVPELVVPGDGGRARRSGLIVHRVRHLTAADVTTVRGIPVTTWARSALDTSAVIRDGHRRMLVRAEQRGLFDLHELRATVARAGRHRGARPLLAALATLHPEMVWSKSQVEEELIALCAARGLPSPVCNATVEGLEVDLHWFAARLVVETDTWGTHGDRAAFQRDRDRDRTLQLAGYRVLRFTDVDLTTDPDRVAADLTRALAR
jgi:hypothetical protein